MVAQQIRTILEEVIKIEKNSGTEIEAIKVGTLQISKKELSFKEILLKGNEYGRRQEYDKAIECYDKAIKIEPNNTKGWNNKGAALSNLGKYNEAIEYLEEAIRLDRNNDYAWNNKGFSLGKLGKYEEAIVCYDKALGIDPTLDLTRRNKTKVLNYLKKRERGRFR